MSENKIQTKLKSYTESASESIIPKNIPKTIIRKLNDRLTIISSFYKIRYTQLHGKRNLVDTYLTFLSYTLLLTQLILMKVTHRDQILLLSHVPIFMIHAMVKVGKLAPLLTYPYRKLHILSCMGKIRTLRPLQTYITEIVTNKHPSQVRTLKLHVNLCHHHHRSKVTTLQRLRSMIFVPKLFRKTHLVILEAANTNYALIPTLITQKYTDIDMCKLLFLFQPLLRAIQYFFAFVFYFFAHTASKISLFVGTYK